ncbi:MarR family winged helix-turn-helix transcriptional regulator [Millisia brevis]|uniref:MarR family winged helix-turn-helix transcriptional regulator n=1 Tax=Millisia brevis TaxID=264148 RepID=UPI00082DA8BF|nr:MarR family transcriptional regulator [Millisia brevis]
MSTDPHTAAFEAMTAVFKRIHLSMESTSLQVLQDGELSISRARALVGLGCQSEPLPVSEVATLVGLSPAAAGRLVDRLVVDGLVRREESPTDRRVKLVALTDEGHAAVLDQRDAKARAVRKILDELTTDEALALASALHPLMLSVQEN